MEKSTNEKTLRSIAELGAEQLRFYCDEDCLAFSTTATVPPLDGMIGQDRAVKAVEFGLNTKKLGYNIFISGMVGTGKFTYAKQVVRRMAKQQTVPQDWCYVNNFDESGQPVAISLPPGMGRLFRQDMKELIENLRSEVPKAFSSDDYEQERAFILKDFQDKRAVLRDNFNEKAAAFSIMPKWSSTGFMMLPLLDGKPVSEEDFNKLDEVQKEKIQASLQAVHDLAIIASRQEQEFERETKGKIAELDQKVALFAVGHLIEEMQEKYGDHNGVTEYLSAVKWDVVKNINDFKQQAPAEEESPLALFEKPVKEAMRGRYAVNLLVDNHHCEGAPVVIEINPTYYNLCGRVEYSSRMGVVSTDFTMIKPGGFHLANGGYLIVNAVDVLTHPGVWEAVKRTLKTKKLYIESLGEQYGLIAMASLKPQAIPIEVKVIMLGSSYLYHILYQYDEDFRKLFKIHADFDVQLDNNRQNIEKLAGFVSTTIKKESLKEFTRAAVARVVEYTARLSGSQNKFTARFNQIVEIVCEADSWAEAQGAEITDECHVLQAIAEKRYRANKYEERIQEMFREGMYLIDIAGTEIGQVNGLAVLGIGEYAFGKPSRITANTYLGREGIINIERETKMSGASHSKGILILSSYLGQKYAQEIPLSLTASLTFEQLYEGVDGDSASSAELYAILSSLADLPLRQDLAVTGSVNQKGEIQPIGGVTEKIEGFFEVCRIKGFTGKQGVLIPQQNIKDLELNEEVIEAVKNNEFHIYAIKNIDEGLELLTSTPAGTVEVADSVHGRVFAKLKLYYAAYGKAKQGKKEDEDN
ncbi:MAG: Lon protease family protein [Selenomonadaceae bacterium]